MGFKTKTSVYGLDNIAGIKLVSTSQNKTAQTVEAQGEDGFVVANQVFGEIETPNEDYILTANASLTSITLGDVTTSEGKSYCINGITITTGAGQVPAVNVTGQQIETGGTESCTAQLPSIAINGLHHAQTFGAFSFGGAGAHLTNSTLAANCTINLASKDGVPLAHDITDGRMTVTGTLQVSDAAYGTPSLTAGTGWQITSPLTETNPDSAYPTYSFTMTKYLSADHA